CMRTFDDTGHEQQLVVVGHEAGVRATEPKAQLGLGGRRWCCRTEGAVRWGGQEVEVSSIGRGCVRASHVGSPAYTCEVCGRPFNNTSAKSQHVQTHRRRIQCAG
ncbi:unnamed protein product, partial [Allacma fusca]